MAILLTQADVEDLVDIPEAIACLEQVFVDQANGAVEAWPPSTLWSGGQYLGFRAGGLSGQHRLGLRVNTLGEAGGAYAMVFESPSGKLLSIMEYPFSDLRLAATVALGIRHLAPADARTVAMIGTGRTAAAIVAGVPAVRSVREILVYSPNEAHRSEFATRVAQELDLPAKSVDDPARAVADADIVLVATNAREPALRYEWLPSRALVVAVGTRMEVEAEVFARAALVVTASRVHELDGRDLADSAPLVQARAAGMLQWDAIVELGEVVTGKHAIPDGLILFREPRGGFSDLALATRAYEKAVALGRGTLWLEKPASPMDV